MTPEERMATYRRAQTPAGGTCTDDELRALTWLWRRGEGPTQGWAARVRELLRESPLRDLASAGVQARDEHRAQSHGTGARKPAAGRGATHPAARRADVLEGS